LNARLPFTDTHVHFHDFSYPKLTWEWLRPQAGPDSDLGDYGAIKAQRYLPDDFLAETRFSGVERVVHVQAAIGSADPVAETAWLQALADRTGIPNGIIGYANLQDPTLKELLTRHMAYPNFRGIRDLRYDDYLTDEDWKRGFALLEANHLIYCDDPLVEHMALLAGLAERHPGLTVCVDHAGFPRRRDAEYFEQWRSGMRQLARIPNTVVKISGLGQCDHQWTVDSLRPWVLTCIELWGPQRAFFGTNWPVDRLFSSYGDVLAAYWDLLSGLSEPERRDLFNGSARRIFRLE
jgi:predicted TIM-barrel fold metal-dependent hydrolase